MKKKILVLICLFLLSGCSMKYINNMTYEQIIDTTIETPNNLNNVNNKGFRYFLPTDFSIYSDNDFNQVLLSYANKYYMYVDVVSYYYENKIEAKHLLDDYKYYTFNNNDKTGYMRITKNNEYFLLELCYNYAIIEVEVKEEDLKYAVSRSISILNSIKYNEIIIEKMIDSKEIESSETIYKLPEPKIKSDSKNVLEYIEESEKDDE